MERHVQLGWIFLGCLSAGYGFGLLSMWLFRGQALFRSAHFFFGTLALLLFLAGGYMGWLLRRGTSRHATCGTCTVSSRISDCSLLSGSRSWDSSCCRDFRCGQAYGVAAAGSWPGEKGKVTEASPSAAADCMSWFARQRTRICWKKRCGSATFRRRRLMRPNGPSTWRNACARLP